MSQVAEQITVNTRLLVCVTPFKYVLASPLKSSLAAVAESVALFTYCQFSSGFKHVICQLDYDEGLTILRTR